MPLLIWFSLDILVRSRNLDWDSFGSFPALNTLWFYSVITSPLSWRRCLHLSIRKGLRQKFVAIPWILWSSACPRWLCPTGTHELPLSGAGRSDVKIWDGFKQVWRSFIIFALLCNVCSGHRGEPLSLSRKLGFCVFLEQVGHKK